MTPLVHEIATGLSLAVATWAAVAHLRRMTRPQCAGCTATSAPASPPTSARGIRSFSLKVLGSGRV